VHARQRLSAKLAEQQPRRSSLSALQEQGHARAAGREWAYQLFRNRQRPELICAVADHRPLPSFLGSEQWLFDGTLGPGEAAPLGFRERAAATGTRLSGFYLFQRLQTKYELGDTPGNTRDRAT
jgi:hypothetical protein